MTVFISCSGSLSKRVGELLHAWLPEVNQGIETWLYSEDIEKGSMWPEEVNKALATTVGILCVTQENKDARWLLFEAGALWKGLEHARVCPLLIDLEEQDVKEPLNRFNFTLPTKEEMWKLLKTINNIDPENKLQEDRLKKSFDRLWREFEEPFEQAREAHKKEVRPPPRKVDDMVVEILKLTRELHRNYQDLLEQSTKPAPGIFGSSSELGSSTGWIPSSLVFPPAESPPTKLYISSLVSGLEKKAAQKTSEKPPEKKVKETIPQKPPDKSA